MLNPVEWGSIRVLGTLVIALLLFVPKLAFAQADKDLIAKGQYIFALAGGCACHTEPKKEHNTGARPFPIPFGTVYSTNITADKETGLGAWSDQQIHAAMTKGIGRDGSRILPVMPYEKYSGMAEEDLKALIAVLENVEGGKKTDAGAKDLGALRTQFGYTDLS